MRTFKRYYDEGYCYFVTSVTEDRRRIFASADLGKVAIETLKFYRDRGDYTLHAYVVMPDHMHLLLTPLKGTISDAMRNVKSWIAKEVRERTGVGGSIWQESFHDTVMRGEEHFAEVVQYIHRNPVVAGFVSEPGDYPFSSWSLWDGAAPESGLGP